MKMKSKKVVSKGIKGLMSSGHAHKRVKTSAPKTTKKPKKAGVMGGMGGMGGMR